MKKNMTFSEFEKLLPNEEILHTFESNFFGMVGCDMTRKDILKKAKTAIVLNFAGSNATAINHGLMMTYKYKKNETTIFIQYEKPITQKLTQKEYKEKKGLNCPICHSSDTEGGERNFQENLIMTQTIKCLKCNSTWEDVYVLKKYTNLKKTK